MLESQISAFKKIFKNNSEIYLRIKVRPDAPKTALKGIMADETLKIDLAAPAEKNKANQELTKFLAKIFEISKTSVIILSGTKDRLKLIKIVA